MEWLSRCGVGKL